MFEWKDIKVLGRGLHERKRQSHKESAAEDVFEEAIWGDAQTSPHRVRHLPNFSISGGIPIYRSF